MKQTLLLLLLLLCSLFCPAQILNIDKNDVGEKEKKWLVNTNLTVSSDQQKNTVLDILLISDISYKVDKRRFVLYTKIDRLTDGTQSIQNAGCFQLRNRIAVRKKYSMDYFVQYQWNGAWGMVNRSLGGANVIHQLINNDSTDLFVGAGIFYEREQWNYAAVAKDKIPLNPHDIIVEHPRLNLTAKYSRTFTNKTDLVLRVFVQPTIYENMLVTRSSLAGQLTWPISKKIAMVTSAELIYDSRPIVPIQNFLFSFSESVSWIL